MECDGHDLLIERGDWKTDAFIATDRNGWREHYHVFVLLWKCIQGDRRSMRIAEPWWSWTWTRTALYLLKQRLQMPFLVIMRAEEEILQCSANVETMYPATGWKSGGSGIYYQIGECIIRECLLDLNLKVNNIIACIARGRKDHYSKRRWWAVFR